MLRAHDVDHRRFGEMLGSGEATLQVRTQRFEAPRVPAKPRQLLLAGQARVHFQLGVEGGDVAELEQIDHAPGMLVEGHFAIAEPHRHLHQLAGDRQALLDGARPPQRPAPIVQHPAQRRRVADAARHRLRLLTELQAAIAGALLRVERVGQPRQDARPQRAVAVVQCGARLFKQAHHLLVVRDVGALLAAARRAPRRPRRAHGTSGRARHRVRRTAAQRNGKYLRTCEPRLYSVRCAACQFARRSRANGQLSAVSSQLLQIIGGGA